MQTGFVTLAKSLKPLSVPGNSLGLNVAENMKEFSHLGNPYTDEITDLVLDTRFGILLCFGVCLFPILK